MADGTVHGGFELSSEQALRSLTAIRDRGREADMALGSLGRTMDQIGGPVATRRLEAYENKLSSVGTTAESTAGKVSTSWSTQTAVVDREAGKIERRIDRLDERLRRYGSIDARANVGLAGWDRANAQLSELEARLDRIDGRTARARVAIGGGFSNFAGGGGGGGGGGQGAVAGDSRSGLFSSLGGIPGRLPWWAAAVPLAPQLIGGAGALVGSAGAGVLGAGTVGLGAMGSLAAGGGLSMAIAKPAITALSAVTKAQEKYNDAVRAFGAHSTQALAAQRAYNAALLDAPMAAGAARQVSLLSREWQTATRPAQANIYRGISGSIYNLRRAVPSVAADARAATSATAQAAISYSGFLAGGQTQGALRALTGSFAQELPIAERSLQNITTLFEHLSVAALPFFHEANVWVQHWTAGMARSTGDTARVQNTMQGLVTSAKDWAHLTGSAAGLLKDIFSAGKPSGDSMVVQLTHTLDRWDTWINRNPAKVRQFFTDASAGVSRIATIVANLAGDVWNLFRALDPIFKRAEQFLSFASGLGGGNLALGSALLYGGYQGARGALGGRGPSAGRAAGAFLLGSPGPLLMGGRAGGGGLVGGGAASATLAAGEFRSSTYLMPRAGFQMPGSVAGGQLPLFAAGAAGWAMRGGRATPILGRGEVAFNQAYGGVAGARYAPLEAGRVVPWAERGGMVGRLGQAGSLARGAIGGAARFIAPLAAIEGILTATQTGGGVPHALGAGLSTAASTLTLGAVSPQQFGGLFHAAFGTDQAGSSLAAAAPGMKALAAQASAVRTPAQLRALQTAVQNVRIQYEMPPDQAAKLQAFLRHTSDVAAHNAGSAASNTWEDAFTRGLLRQGPTKAVKTMLAGMHTQLRELGPQGAKDFAKSTAAWVAQMEADNPKLRRPLERLMGGIVKDLNQLDRTTGTTMKDLRDKIFFFNGEILTGSQTTWGKIKDALVNPALVAQEKLAGIFGMIQQEAINALTGMGFSHAQAQAIVTATAKGGRSLGNAGVSVGLRQSGGPATSPLSPQAPAGVPRGRHRERGGVIGGHGLLDTVPTPDGGMAAPGEAWIANRHTMNDISRATIKEYGRTAWQMIRDEHRTHSAPGRQLGGVIAGALGKVSSAVGGASHTVAQAGGGWVARQHPELHAGIAAAVQDVLDRFPLAITSTTGGGHVAGSYHYLGEAADIAGDSGLMYRASQWIKSSGLAGGLTEGIHNPNLAVYHGQVQSPPGSFAGVWAGHANHIHMAVAGALKAALGGGGALGATASNISLRAPSSGLAGIPGALADQASRIYAAGLAQQVNKRTGATGISGAGFSGGGGSQANQALGRRMMLAAGWPASEWPALQALWTQESGWSSTAVNPSSGAYGIPQSLGHGHPYNLGDAPAQIAWGLNYVRGRYGSPSAAEAHERAFNWYQRGGRVNWAGWNARGANFTTNGPTVFGAGEKGREHVTVTPAGHADGRQIVVRMERVYLNDGDTHQLEKVAQDVAGKILDALDRVGAGTSDHALVGASG